jgi:hypothetical protein
LGFPISPSSVSDFRNRQVLFLLRAETEAFHKFTLIRIVRAVARMRTLIAGMFVTDTLCLTAVLMFTGGPNNSFSLLYLVHITLSAIILRRRQTQALGVLACLCFALLFRFYHEMGIRLTQVTAIGRIRAEWKITGGT